MSHSRRNSDSHFQAPYRHEGPYEDIVLHNVETDSESPTKMIYNNKTPSKIFLFGIDLYLGQKQSTRNFSIAKLL